MRHSIEELAAEYYSAAVRVEVEKVKDEAKAPPSLHQTKAQEETDRQKKLKQNAEEHPMVRSALEIFGGNIEEIRPIDKGFV
ncbi:MAG: DNA polymerase III subunit gamma/tau, partial [Desulfuromonadales bacterium]|nr:DNA polymerase III subunit gamma/tau [Desulfuromonadales bacterium]